MRARGGRRSAAVVLSLALAAGACSGGGGTTASDDLQLGKAGESVLQFQGAGKLSMGGTLAMPDTAGNGPVGAVLIVPSAARNNRDGYIDVIPDDPIYRDLSKAFTDAGMAAFRYDRRSMGLSKIEPDETVTFDDMVTDAREALLFLSQRAGIDAKNLAIVGHDVGGIIAMRVAAGDDSVRSVALVSAPGRPMVDIMAAYFESRYDKESADTFRGLVATLISTGTLPERGTIRPEHQTVLPLGQDALLKGIYGLDPVAEAAKLKVKTLVVSGKQGDFITPVDGAKLTAALPSAQAFTAESSASLQKVTAALPQAFDPENHQSHGGGRPPETAVRDDAAVAKLTTFLSASLHAAGK